MPYSNINDPEKTKLMEDCVAKVKAKGGVGDPYAICYASIVQGHSAEEVRDQFKLSDDIIETLSALKVPGAPEILNHSERIAIEEFMAADFKRPFRILPIGRFYRDERILDITAERAKEVYDNWKLGLPRYGLSVTVEHGNDKSQSGAIGRVKEIALRPDGIYAEKTDFSKAGEELLNEDRYRAVSPEIIWTLNENSKYQDPKTGAWHDNVLVGLAVTTTPFFGQDVQVFSVNKKGDEKFESPTRHQVHVESTGGNMDKSKMTDAQKKAMKEMMDAGKSEEDAIKALDGEKKEEKLEEGRAISAPETFAVGESFVAMKATIEALTAKLGEADIKHEALVHQFAAERQLRRTVEFIEGAEKFSALPAKQDELGMKLLALYDADASATKDLYNYFDGLLTQLNQVASQSELFASVGSERFDSESGDPFIAAVEKIRAEKFGVEKYEDGFAKAYNLAGSLHKDLARQYVMRNTHVDR